MKIGFIIFQGMTALDFVGIYDPLTRLKTMGFFPDLEWEIDAFTFDVIDSTGLRFSPTRVAQPLVDYDIVVLPGGPGSRILKDQPDFLEWLRTAAGCPLKVSVCTGALLLGAAGFLQGKKATTHTSALDELRPYCAVVDQERIVDEGDVITGAGVTSSIDLGLYLVEKLSGPETKEKIRRRMEYGEPWAIEPMKISPVLGSRSARVYRKTNETEIQIVLKLDGTGIHQIGTGIGFLDHMLSHVAVHGLFDLQIHANGDLEIDVHHTLEDVAIAFGQAFTDALGDRAGIVRIASAYVPMDEALAFVVVDFSGRPYAVIEADFHSPSAGNIPTSLFAHFLESFATSARCNLHARLLSGRDDHHQAEALFKALGRALDAATQVDPRRIGSVPSTKGTLTV